jgi:hypothetical protein
VVVNDIITSVQALAMGDLDRLDSTSQEVLRRCGVIDYEPYRCWGHLLRARLHQERHDIAAAVAKCQLAVSSARLLDLTHFRSFALTQLGQLTALPGNLLGAKALLEEAIEEAENGAGWFIAFAKVALAGVRRQQENPADAESLLQEVLDWGAGTVAGGDRVTLYRRLADDPLIRAAAQKSTADTQGESETPSPGHTIPSDQSG